MRICVVWIPPSFLTFNFVNWSEEWGVGGGGVARAISNNEFILFIYIQPVWDLITDMTLEKGDCQLALNNLFTILCGLAEHFLTPPLPVAAEDITKAPAFWEILQCGLVQADPLVRKRAMYLLKKALDFTEESGDIVVVNSSEVRPVFYWDPARKADLLGVWQDYFLLMETLEERQVWSPCL